MAIHLFDCSQRQVSGMRRQISSAILISFISRKQLPSTVLLHLRSSENGKLLFRLKTFASFFAEKVAPFAEKKWQSCLVFLAPTAILQPFLLNSSVPTIPLAYASTAIRTAGFRSPAVRSFRAAQHRSYAAF